MERYEAYKDSGVEWIGAIPANWEVRPIRTLATYNDETLSEATDSDYRFEYVDISAVSEGSIDATSEQVFSSSPSRARRIIRRRDVLVSTVRTYLKAIALVDEEHDGLIASTGFCVLRPRRDTNSRWFGYAVSEDTLVDEIVARSVGVSYPAINASDLVKLQLRYPPIEEQRNIAAYLDAKTAEIDALAADCEREVELLQEYRKAVISEAVTKGLDPEAPMRDSGIEWIGEIPEEWKTTRIKQVAALQTGKTPSTSRPDFFDGDVPWFTPGDLKSFEAKRSERSVSTLAVEEGAVDVVPAGSVLLVGVGYSSGKSALATIDCSTNQQITAVMPSGIDSRYLAYVIHVVGGEILKLATFNRVPLVNNEFIGNLYIPLPNGREQARIVAHVDAKTAEIDSLIDAKQSMADKLREYRRSLISEVVTGKFKVTSI